MTPAYESPLANKYLRLARLSRFGFLGFLGLLGFLGVLPGCERLFGLSGFSGLGGMFGFAAFYTLAARAEARYPPPKSRAVPRPRIDRRIRGPSSRVGVRDIGVETSP